MLFLTSAQLFLFGKDKRSNGSSDLCHQKVVTISITGVTIETRVIPFTLIHMVNFSIREY